MADSRRGASVRLLVVFAIVLALIGYPVATLVGIAIGDGPAAFGAALTDRRAVDAIVNSIVVGVSVAVLAVVAGAGSALAVERSAVPAARWLRLGLLVPLLVPPFVTAFGWTRAYGPRGLLDQALGASVPGLYGPVGIVLVLAVAATPLTFLVVAGALASRVEPELERAARASGAGRLAALATVTLPLLRPALLAAAVVAFVFAVNAFGVPAILGTPAGFATITTRLYQDLAFAADPASFTRAATLASILLVLALVVVGSADALLPGRPAARSGAAPAGMATPGGHVATVVLVVAVGLGAVAPFVALVLTAITRAIGLPPVPANWTLGNFAEAMSPTLAGGLARSLVLAAAGASVVLVLGSIAAVSIGRGRGRIVGSAVTLGFAVPGSALAVAILLAYGGWLRDTLAIILVAYVAKFWALGHRQLAGSLDRLPADALRAARASGGGPPTVLATIVAPILRPALVGGWLVVFVFALHELTMSSLLYGPGTATLAVTVLNVQQLGDPTVSAALSVLLTAVVAAAAVPLVLLGFARGRGAVSGRS